MQFRAIIFDIYGTLLEVGSAPENAEARWRTLWKEKLKVAARLGLVDFSAACDTVIEREHTAARASGLQHPEVYWPNVVSEVLPELMSLSGSELDDFLFQQAQLWHTVRLSPEAAQILSKASQANVLLGLASNCQPYTLRELDAALASAGLSFTIFKSELCFFSFAHGFAKPDPHVFRLLLARLKVLGISPTQTLMVGDRPENDIDSARAQAFRVWQLTPYPTNAGTQSGDWHQLAFHLGLRNLKSGQR
jgi:putative hydrolase of the HAD superfamily